jgi:O6-methylguanine-DNA--protein-cysteine methyltransferase
VIYASLESPLGPMTASAKGHALTGLWFVDGRYYPSDSSTWAHEPDHPVFVKLCAWLDDYFGGGRNVPL